MKMSEWILDKASTWSRGELREVLADCLLSLKPTTDDEPLSNGSACDAMLFAIDAIAVSPEQQEQLRKFVDEYFNSGEEK